MEEDLTSLILNYRNGIRKLWNSYAQHLDAEHRFQEVERAFFYFAVLSQTGNGRLSQKHPSEQYYKFLKVCPILETGQEKPLIGKKNSTGGYNFDYIDLISKTGLELRFMYLFDTICNFPRRYQYVMCYILEADNHEIRNHVVLLGCENAQYYALN